MRKLNGQGKKGVREWIGGLSSSERDMFIEMYKEKTIPLPEMAKTFNLPIYGSSAPVVSIIAKHLGLPPRLVILNKTKKRENSADKIARLQRELKEAQDEEAKVKKREEKEIRQFVHRFGGILGFQKKLGQLDWDVEMKISIDGETIANPDGLFD